MYDQKSAYALNKKDIDAIVCPNVTGKPLRLTRADFDSEEEFIFWKNWSDRDYQIQDNAETTEKRYTVSLCGHRHRGDTACSCIHLNEANLQAACDRALVTLFRNQEEILRSLIAGLERLHERVNHTQTRIYEIDSAMQVLRRQIHTLSSLQAQGILDAADFADQTRILNQRVSALRAERQQILTYEESDDTMEELYALSDTLQDADEEDKALRLELIKKIYVRSETDIDIVLPGGLILPERLPLLKKRCKRS